MKKEIKVACGGVCVLESNGKDSLLTIKDGVKCINNEQCDAGELTKELQKLRGNLKVVGGKDLESAVGLFMDCNFDTVDLSEIACEKLKNTTLMFGYSKIGEIKFGRFNMLGVVKAQQMFGCSEIGEMDIAGWKVDKIEDMKCMFFRCRTKVLDLSGWNFDSVKRYNWMLKGAIADIKCNNEEILRTIEGDLDSLVK